MAQGSPERAGTRPIRRHPASRRRKAFPIVALGASAGGLGACSRFLDALSVPNGMAFVLVQHLDPTHASMMVELLGDHTTMPVLQAADGMPIEPDHLYIIPPATYLSVAEGILHLSQPDAPHGARLPFDFLLRSLVEDAGENAACVILSGTGADGSLGAMLVKKKGGLVIAQDPEEAEFGGMPRSAIAAGAVDLTLPVMEIPKALAERKARRGPVRDSAQKDAPDDELTAIIDLLRTKTAHDFRFYKQGTLRRRIERRMAMAAVPDMGRYIDLLRKTEDEADQLARDLLIHVTGFFRDPKVFEFLAEHTIPELIRNHAADQPLRIWIAGCSTGEETYSLAILFQEEIAATKSGVKLQVFASDVDPAAVVKAREGLYPKEIEADVSAARLTRFFTREGQDYKVTGDLRSAVIFTVQDVLADPPFSRLDMISCRNLLIYLRPEAQTNVIALFHFALRDGGLLLLGNAETIGNGGGGFAAVSKSQRLYRRTSRSRPGNVKFLLPTGDGVRVPARPGAAPLSRQAALAELCRRLILETYAPAAVLINREHECLYSLGPVDCYLRLVSGPPTNDLFALVRDGTRIKLRAAIHQAIEENKRAVVAGGRIHRDGKAVSFQIAAQPVRDGEDTLLLICFIEEPTPVAKDGRPAPAQAHPRVAALEQELDATKFELETAIRNLEMSSEEQRAINEEALSVNEEYQSTNEELLTSKEELQSLNEELTALNSQLQETLERQRTTSNDLQNVLYSTHVATLFLDTDLNIRFFTPATRSLFNILQSDVGRPLADLSWLAKDTALEADARAVLGALEPIEREIEAGNHAWYLRRILPYRTHDGLVEGVVITFTDVTERKRVAKALETARQQADRANIAKSRFLAAASHDLRQPLQTLSLLQGLLANAAEGEPVMDLVTLMDQTVSAMSGMLNALLDINQIDAGAVHAEMTDFPVADLLGRIVEEFAYHAQSKGLVLHAVPCGLAVHSDPRLLEQMVRNLVSNALKYTMRGKVLLGCRRHGSLLSIEVWDTGIGIPEGEVEAIFEEYHQIGIAARDRSRGLGLGLSIVQRLGGLLGHPIHVRSQPGKGSVFAIDVERAPDGTAPRQSRGQDAVGPAVAPAERRTGRILMVEDDPELRHLLELFLNRAGHRAAAAADGAGALDMVTNGTIRPDLIIADYNLPGSMNGLEVGARLRDWLDQRVPVIILTGDISTGTLRDISLQDCVPLNKPVKMKRLAQVIQSLLPKPPALPAPVPDAEGAASPTVFLVDDDSHIRTSIRDLLREHGLDVEDYASGEAFLENYQPRGDACLLVDAKMPGMDGIDVLRRLRDMGHWLPAIVITGHGDVAMAVEAMKAGALDFIVKPVDAEHLLASVGRGLENSRDKSLLHAGREAAASLIDNLTPRQRQVMDLILAGVPNKNIALDLGISQRTVENHRAAIMKATGSKNLPALIRTVFAAEGESGDEEGDIG